MPTSPRPNPVADAYALEAAAWLALDGRIPGDPRHDPAAWAAWRHALHAALKASEENAARAGARPPQGGAPVTGSAEEDPK